MSLQIAFKDLFSFEQRVSKHNMRKEKNPDQIFLIVESHNKSTLPSFLNARFMIHKNMKFSIVKTILWKNLSAEKDMKFNTFFVFVNGKLPDSEITMQQLYGKYKDKDGFLYLKYSELESL